MPNTLLPTLLLQILLIGYTPGPANIYSFTMSLRNQRRELLIMWLGLLTGFSFALLSIVYITHYIGIAFSEYVVYLKYLGGAYIAYLSYSIFTSENGISSTEKNCTFVSGMIVQMTNAKMMLFETTVFGTYVLPHSNKIIDLIEVGAWLLIAGPLANLVWLLAGSYMRQFFVTYGRKVDVFSAVALLLCAVYIII